MLIGNPAGIFSMSNHEDMKSPLSEGAKKIVIVPDQKTFLYYLSTWNPDNRFPIFINKNKFVDKFASVYNGGNNYFEYADSKNTGKITRSTAYKVLRASLSDKNIDDFSQECSKSDLINFFTAKNIKPQGLVLTGIKSSKLPAALALASYHGQILDFYTPPASSLLGAYSEKSKEIIRKDIINIIQSWGYPYKGLGNGIDAITIALNMPFKYSKYYSLDDAVNRETPNAVDCYAYTGRLLDVVDGMALYQAMCSIFLNTQNCLLFDKWPPRWGRSLELGAWELRKKIPCLVIRDSFKKWRRLVEPLNRFDLIFINAAGSPDNWSGGTLDDIPDTEPVAIHFAHSSSAADPTNPNTIAGKWLLNGAFIYYGAISEPYADSFNRSLDMAERLIKGAPFGAAVQNKTTIPKNRAKPWRLILIGDPLFKPKFRPENNHGDYFQVMKSATLYLENLQFGEARSVLEHYLNSPKTQSEPKLDVYGQQAKTYLTKIYDLLVCESILGSVIYKYYNKGFVMSWIADYPYTEGIRRRVYLKDDKLVEAYYKLHKRTEKIIKKGSHLEYIWKIILLKMRQRKSFVSDWKIIGPVLDNPDNAQLFKNILESNYKNNIIYNGMEYKWVSMKKNPLNGRLEIKKSKKLGHQVWAAVSNINVDSDLSVYLRFFAECPAKIYIDGKFMFAYSKDILYTTTVDQIKLSSGNHKILIFLYIDKNKYGNVVLRLTDSKHDPVEKIHFLP